MVGNQVARSGRGEKKKRLKARKAKLSVVM
jgi:hypothetical protein